MRSPMVLALLVVLAGCGGEQEAREALAQTAANLKGMGGATVVVQVTGAGEHREETMRVSAAELEAIDLRDWIEEPTLTEGREVDEIAGRLDVEAAAGDLRELAERLRVPVSPDQLADSVRDARIELATGARDRLLRGLTIEADVGLDAGPLGPLVGGFVDAHVVLEITVDGRAR